MSELTPTISTTTVEQTLSKSKKSSSKGKPRSSKRIEGFREKKSLATDLNEKKAIYDKLYFGFKTEHKALESLQVVSTPRSVIIATSTRAIGFIIRLMICKFARLGIRNLNVHALCCALYRVSLRQLDLKIYTSLQNASSKNRGHGFQATFVDYDTTQALGTLGAVFAPLANLISAVGLFKAFGTQYIPRFANQTVRNLARQYDPTLVTFSELREFVAALSNNATPAPVRLYFYQHSPFPNAIWTVVRQRRPDADDQIDVILENPDEIMPVNYNPNNFLADINLISDSIELIGRKYDKYVHVGGIDYHSPGNWSQLVSNNQGDLRCKDLTRVNDVPNYFMTDPLEGDVDFFWSMEMLSEPEFYLGALHLLGEIPHVMQSQSYNRDESNGKQDGAFSFVAGLTNLLG